MTIGEEAMTTQIYSEQTLQNVDISDELGASSHEQSVLYGIA